jgi:hypothetical protein
MGGSYFAVRSHITPNNMQMSNSTTMKPVMMSITDDARIFAQF